MVLCIVVLSLAVYPIMDFDVLFNHESVSNHESLYERGVERGSDTHYYNNTFTDITPSFTHFYTINDTFTGYENYFTSYQNSNGYAYMFQKYNFTKSTNLTKVIYYGVRFGATEYPRTFRFIITDNYTNIDNPLYTDDYVIQSSDGVTWHTIVFDIPHLSVEGNLLFCLFNPIYKDTVEIYVKTVKNTTARGMIYMDTDGDNILAMDNITAQDMNMSVIAEELGYEPDYNYTINIQSAIYDMADIVFVDTVSISYQQSVSANDYVSIIYGDGGTGIYYLNDTGEYVFSPIGNISKFIIYLSATQYNYNSITSFTFSIYKNDIPILLQDSYNVVIDRNSKFDIFRYINATDPDGDRIIFEMSPDPQDIDTSIPTTYSINITLYDDVKYPYTITSYLNVSIKNTAPSLINYTVICNYQSLLYGEGFKNATIDIASPERLYYVNITLPPNSTAVLSDTHNYYDREGDIITIASEIPSMTNRTTGYIYTVILDDGYLQTIYNIVLSITIPIEYHHNHTLYEDRIVNQTINQTVIEYRDKIVYVNNTIVKYKYIYINNTDNDTNSTNSTEQDTESSEKPKSIAEAWRDFLSDPDKAFPFVALIFILISIAMVSFVVSKFLPYYMDKDEDLSNDDLKDDIDIEEVVDAEEIEDAFSEDLNATGFQEPDIIDVDAVDKDD